MLLGWSPSSSFTTVKNSRRRILSVKWGSPSKTICRDESEDESDDQGRKPGRALARGDTIPSAPRVPAGSSGLESPSTHLHPPGGFAIPSRQSRRVLRRVLWTLLTLAVVGACAWGAVRVLHRPPLVEVAQTRREDVTRLLAVTGRVRPRQVNQVRPLAAGRLTALPKEEGDAVRPGELLARVDDREARAALAQTRAAVQVQRQELEQARRDLARSESLFTEGLIPEDRLEQARLAVDRGREELARLQEAVRQAEVRLDDYALTSPLAGRVLRRPVDPGQIVDTATVLYEIATGEDPWVEAEVDEIYLPELREGMAARIASPGRRDRVWPATVVLLGDRVDPATGSVTVRLAFDGEVPDLPAGLSLDVNLTVARHPDAVTVSRAAVADLDGDAWVLTVEPATETESREVSRGGSVTRRRPVRVIDWPAERVVVLEGLEADETVVLTPQDVPADLAVRTRDPGTDAPTRRSVGGPL